MNNSGLIYPALAIVFSRALNAFQISGPQQTKDGDFYALMFFVLAIANFFVYGVIGWYSNAIAQVSVV